MENLTETDVNPFDSLNLVIKVLIWAGFYEIQSSSKCVRVSHFIYRILAITIVVVYNIVHLMFILMTDADIAEITYALVVEIPELNLFVKAIYMFIHKSRIRHINQLINDPVFAATNKEDAEYLRKNNQDMLKLTRLAMWTAGVACGLFVLTFVFKRLDNPQYKVPAYMSFDTSTTMRYVLSVLLEISPMFWIGYGHLMADSIIAIYYSQAVAQLKLLKNNLENIFNSDSLDITDASAVGFRYIDVANDNIKKRFIYLIERYKMIVWYVNEVTYVFERSMSFQFFTATLASCLVIYQLGMANIMSISFMHMFIVLIIFQFQVFLYCYFGYLVEYESKSINTAVYFSDWLSVSPRFRRDMLIAMMRWSKPIRSRVSTIVPVSMITFVSIVKSSYRLYTVMKSTHL